MSRLSSFLMNRPAALDPEAAKTVRDFIETLRGQGRTIFLCTHNLDEAERLCDRIGVFKQRLIAVDAPDTLRRQLFGRQTVIHLAPGSPLDQLALVVGGLAGVKHVQPMAPDNSGSAQLVISLSDPASQNPAIVRALIEHGADVQFVNELKHSLEDVYLSLIHDGAGNQGGAR